MTNDAMAGKNALINLVGRDVDLKATLRAAATDIRQFGRERATAELKVKSDEALTEIRRVKAELAESMKLEGVNARIAHATNELTKYTKKFAEFQAISDPTEKQQAAGARIATQMEKAQQAVSKLNAEREKIEASVQAVHIDVEPKLTGLPELLIEVEEMRSAVKFAAGQTDDIEFKAKLKVEDSELGRLKARIERGIAGAVGGADFHTASRDVDHYRGRLLSLGSDAPREVARGMSLIGSVMGAVGKAFIGAGTTALTFAEAVGQTAVKVASAVPVIGSSLGEALAGVVADAAIAPVAIVALVVAVAALAAVAAVAAVALNAMLALFVALASSLAFAVAGAAALGVALLAIAGPAVGVLIAMFAQLGDVIKAVQGMDRSSPAHKQQLADEAAAVRDLADAHQASVDARRQAQDQIKDAQTAARDAVEGEVDSYRRLKEAAEAARDAQRDSALNVAQAKLNLDKANTSLKTFKDHATSSERALFKKFQNVSAGALPGLLDSAVKHGEITEKQSEAYRQLIIDQQRAQGAYNDAQQTAAKFAKDGPKAYAPYTDAIKAHKDAVKRAGDAQKKANEFTREGVGNNKQVITALRTERDAAERAATARKKLTEGQDGLSKGQLDFAKQLRGLLDYFKNGSSITDPLFAAMATGIKRLRGHLDDIAPHLEGLRDKVAKSFSTVIEKLTSKDSVDFLNNLLDMSGKFVEKVTPGLTALFDIFKDIIEAAGPQLLDIVGKVSEWLEGIAEKPDRTKSKVGDMITSFKKWAGLAVQLFEFLGRVMDLTHGRGDKVIGGIGKTFENLNKMLSSKKGQKDFLDWFDDSMDSAEDILKLVRDILKLVARIADRVADVGGAAHDAWEWVHKHKLIWALVKTQIGMSVGAIGGFFTPLGNLLTHIGDIKSAWHHVRDAIKSVIDWLKKIHWPKPPSWMGLGGGEDTDGDGTKDKGRGLLRKGLDFANPFGSPKQKLKDVTSVFTSGTGPMVELPNVQLASAKAAATGLGGGTVNQTINNNITVPGGGPPDTAHLARKLSQDMSLTGAPA